VDTSTVAVPLAPGGLPGLGHLLGMARGRAVFLQRLRAGGDIVEMRLGRRSFYLLNAPEAVHEVLVAQSGKFSKGMLFDRVRPYLGNGLATSDGPFHLSQRRALQPAFHREQITRYTATFTAVAGERVGGWRPGRTIAMDREMHELAVAMLLPTLFPSTGEPGTGRAIDDLGARVADDLGVLVHGVLRATILPPALAELPTPGRRRFLASADSLRQLAESAVREARRNPSGDGVLTLLLAAQGGMPDEAERGGSRTASDEADRVGSRTASGEAERGGTRIPSGEADRVGSRTASGETDRAGTPTPSGEAERGGSRTVSDEADRDGTRTASDKTDRNRTPTMSDEAARDEILTLLVAGIETTATTLSWALHALARDPEIAQRIHEEAVAAGPDAATPAALPYTARFVQEVLRLHQPLWFMGRRALEPVRIGRHELPRGAEVVYSAATLHRDPALFPDPLRFAPDRWLARPEKSLPRGAFVPFGAGNRKCVGDGFAWAEMLAVLAAVTTRWHLHPAPGHRVRAVADAQIHPDALPMSVTPR